MKNNHLVSRFFLTLIVLAFTQISWALDCDQTNAKFWMDRATNMISLRDFKAVSSNRSLLQLEKAVAINAKITAAYAGLYQSERDRSAEFARTYLWLPGAAFASFEVGQVIRHAYLSLNQYRDSSFDPRVYGPNPLEEVVLGDLKVTGLMVALKLIEGNKAVFADLYWQHLSTSECGITTTVRLLSNLAQATSNSEDKTHWNMLKDGWKLIQAGEFEKGNIALTRVEQQIVLQPLIYAGALGTVGGRIFAEIGRSPIRDPDFFFPDFIGFCRDHGLRQNFSRFKSRWPWIVEQMKAMGRFFERFPESLKGHHLFMVRDSGQILAANL